MKSKLWDWWLRLQAHLCEKSEHDMAAAADDFAYCRLCKRAWDLRSGRTWVMR